LISVSMRFQNEMEVLTNDIKPSIAHFMAYVHGSVNEMSKVRVHPQMKIINKQTNKREETQRDIHKDKHSQREFDKPTNRHPDKQTSKQADKVDR
jgi:hypothetical protein